MQKIIWKIVLIVAPLLFAGVLLYPTYRAYELESQEFDRLEKAEKAESSLDSMAIMEEFYKAKGEALEKSKERRLKLGLDLRGGMYVVLEIDVVKLIEESAQKETIDQTFKEVIEKTRSEDETSEESTIDIFLKNFNEIARPKGKTLISYFPVQDVKNASEEKIVEKLQENARSAVDQAMQVIQQRIDRYGVSEPNIQKQGNERILLELPGVKNREQIRELIETTARLEFKLVRNNQDIVKAFYKINEFMYNRNLRRQGEEVEQPEPEVTDTTVAAADSANVEETTEEQIAETTDTTATDTTSAATASADTAASDTSSESKLSDEEAAKKYVAEHPFTRLFSTFFIPEQKNAQIVPVYYDDEQFDINNVPEGRYMFRISGDSLKKFLSIIKSPEIAPMIPEELEIAVEANPDQDALQQEDTEIYTMYALKSEPELIGEVITDAMGTFDQATNQPIVIMQMNTEGAEDWSRITGANIGKQIAIVLDEEVYSAPVVNDKITSGRSQISGMADAEEARLLEIVLKAGALKAPVKIARDKFVGPSLGQDSINKGFMASIVAFLLVIIFMVFYYNKGGMIADIAVLINVMLIMSILAALSGTLTLPGIAGIILTIGMAVDANVLIFERIREELYKGRSLRSAVDEGFSKALSAIMDSNITTFFTGMILYYFGSGPIQGFALTLMIGIGGTLFTAIFIARAFIDISILKGATEFNFGQPKIVQEKK